MIITSLVETVAYRVHQPRWAFDPISGAGAAAEGGRANRKGLHALYLALDPQTAIVLRVDAQARFERFVAVVDLLKARGLDRLTILTRE